MVEVYNGETDDLDQKIKIIVLPNNQAGKDVYDFAKEMIKENIE